MKYALNIELKGEVGWRMVTVSKNDYMYYRFKNILNFFTKRVTSPVEKKDRQDPSASWPFHLDRLPS